MGNEKGSKWKRNERKAIASTWKVEDVECKGKKNKGMVGKGRNTVGNGKEGNGREVKVREGSGRVLRAAEGWMAE